jgi:hypothetical protein
MKKKENKNLIIKKGIFFKEDFQKLPDDIIIYIEKGVLITK